MKKQTKTTKITVTTLLILLVIRALTSPASAAEGRIWGKFGEISRAAYDKPWYCCEVLIYVAPEIKTGKVSATFTAGGKTYHAGSASVSEGTVISGGKYKNWRKIRLSATSRTGIPSVSGLRIVLHG